MLSYFMHMVSRLIAGEKQAKRYSVFVGERANKRSVVTDFLQMPYL